MHYYFEAIFVGLYVCCIYYIVNNILFIENFYLLLFICGFLKHFLGFLFGIWNWYCIYGFACKEITRNDKLYKKELPLFSIIKDSIYEAFLFLLVGMILHIFLKNKILLFFIIGFGLHIIFEYIGIHKFFCIHNCGHGFIYTKKN